MIKDDGAAAAKDEHAVSSELRNGEVIQKVEGYEQRIQLQDQKATIEYNSHIEKAAKNSDYDDVPNIAIGRISKGVIKNDYVGEPRNKSENVASSLKTRNRMVQADDFQTAD